MKRSICILSAAVSVMWPLTTPSQSTFVFNNHYGVDAPVFDWQGNRLVGASYQAEMYGGATANSLTPTTTVDFFWRVILPFGSGTNAGYVTGRAVVMVADAPPGGFAWLQMRAWDARLGATYEEVAALGLGGYGESLPFYADGGDPTQLPAGAPEPLIGLESFSLRPIIPEPSVSALLTVGGVAWWMVRRRRGAFGQGKVL